jgi:hypothetical protein
MSPFSFMVVGPAGVISCENGNELLIGFHSGWPALPTSSPYKLGVPVAVMIGQWFGLNQVKEQGQMGYNGV